MAGPGDALLRALLRASRDRVRALQRLRRHPRHVRRGTPGASPGTFVNGFHETWRILHAEQAYGLARTGQTIVNVPDATVLRLFVDDEPLFLPTARLRHYARTLEMREGALSRELAWSTPSGKHVLVCSCRLVS